MKSRLQAFLICLLALCATARAEQSTPTESELKAAFVYNFIALAPWEPSVERVELCIVGDTLLRRGLERLSGRSFGKNQVLSTRWAAADALDSCNAVFISADQASELDHLLTRLKGKRKLTMSDTPGFGRAGVMLNLTLQDDRVRFEANRATAAEAGLPISSRLLSLATEVFEARPSPD